MKLHARLAPDAPTCSFGNISCFTFRIASKPIARCRRQGIGCSLLALMLLIAGGAHAQVFKWVGPDGKVNYSDVPPPPAAILAEKKNFTGNVVDGIDMPFELAEVARSHPVTLYTGEKCQPCDDGRKLLNTRGIPFAEKTVTSNADIAILGTGAVQLPQLMIGKTAQRGFEPAAWNTQLSAAGYPESNKLPKNFRNPPPNAAASKSEHTEQAPEQSTADANGNSVAASPGAARPRKRPVPPAPVAEPATPGLRF